MTKLAEKSQSQKKQEDWMNSKWRPMMGWMYMTVCVMDFVVFPILWSLLQSMSHGQVTSQWQPLTLQGAGLFHVAMGGVLGLAAYGRTQEKIAGANNGGLQNWPSNGAVAGNFNNNGSLPHAAQNGTGNHSNNFFNAESSGQFPSRPNNRLLAPPPAEQPLM